jgi:hypothetical protein
MNNIRELKDENLLIHTKKLVVEERAKTLEVIESLQEIYDRRLHSKCGFKSMHEYLVNELKYSDGSAYRRLSAMKLTQDLPEVKQSIADGKISLSTAAAVQSFFNKVATPKEQKLEILSKLEGASKLTCEKELAKLSPEIKVPEELMTVVLDEELKSLIAEFRELSCDSNPNNMVLLKKVFTTAIKQLKKSEKASPEKLEETTNNKDSRYIPEKMKRIIYKRAHAQCEYADQKTKRRCTARHYLEVDHIIPHALGGETTLDNLQLLCRAHNQFRARQIYGKEKMAQFQARAA